MWRCRAHSWARRKMRREQNIMLEHARHERAAEPPARQAHQAGPPGRPTKQAHQAGVEFPRGVGFDVA